MTNTFTISFNNKPLKIKLMIDSGSKGTKRLKILILGIEISIAN